VPAVALALALAMMPPLRTMARKRV